MAKDDTYAQCELRRMAGKFDVAWLPEKFAQKGRMIRFKDDSGSWEDRWKVMEVYAKRCSLRSKRRNETSFTNAKHQMFDHAALAQLAEAVGSNPIQ